MVPPPFIRRERPATDSLTFYIKDIDARAYLKVRIQEWEVALPEAGSGVQVYALLEMERGLLWHPRCVAMYRTYDAWNFVRAYPGLAPRANL